MAKKRAKSLAITLPSVSLDARDGPTPEWLNHHVAIARAALNAVCGKRRQTLAERLMRQGKISPAACDGIWRLGEDRERSRGGGASPMYRLACGTPAGTGSYDVAEAKLDRWRAFRAAAKAIGPEATRVLIWVAEDAPLRQDKLHHGCHRTTARRVAEHATALALH